MGVVSMHIQEGGSKCIQLILKKHGDIIEAKVRHTFALLQYCVPQECLRSFSLLPPDRMVQVALLSSVQPWQDRLTL